VKLSQWAPGLLRGAGDQFYLRATSYPLLKRRMDAAPPYTSGMGKTGRVIATGRGCLVVAPTGETLPSASPDFCETEELANSFIAAPIKRQDGNGCRCDPKRSQESPGDIL